MNDDYLWNRKGEIHPDIAHLEGALAPLRYKSSKRFQAGAQRGWLIPVSVAAAALILTAASITWRTHTARSISGWTIYAGAMPLHIRCGVDK